MKEFILKCVTVTGCLIVLSSFVPVKKYDFISEHVRCNKITGKVERYSTASYNRGWSE